MNELCLSSELYPVEPGDIAALADATSDAGNNRRTEGKIIVLIGNKETGEKDTLLCGREEVERALARKQPFVPVRFAFASQLGRFDFISVFIKRLRNRHKIFSSEIYHMDPLAVRRLKVERNIRTRQNAYVFSNPLYIFDKAERRRRYEELYQSMQNGYNDKYPIDIMLLRMMGIKDTVNQGHHRMGIAVELKLPRIAVRFSAAGAAPKILRPLLKIIADININLKLWSKNK